MPSANQTCSGSLSFRELVSFDRRNEPISFALPLKEGALHEPSHIELHDGDVAVPTQTRALSRWRDGSIRWLLVRSQVDLPGAESKAFTWRVGEAPNAYKLDSHVKVERSDAGLRVHTGALELTIPQAGDALVSSVHVDGKALPGSLTRFALDVAPTAIGKVRSGRTGGASGEASGEASGGASGAYASSATERLVSRWDKAEIVDSGPLCAVVRLDGWYREPDWAFSARLTFHAGKPYFELEHRFVYLNPNDSAYLHKVAFAWQAGPGAGKAQLTLGSGRKSIDPTSQEDRLSERTGAMDLFGNEYAIESFAADFWGAHAAAGGGSAISVFQARQNFPVGMDIDQSRLETILAAAEENPLEIRPGVGKTHRLLVHFFSDDTSREEISKRSHQFQLPDRPTLPVDVYRDARVWPDVFPERLCRRLEMYILDKADNRAVGAGMLHFGDGPDAGYTSQRRGGDDLVWTNNEYDFAHTMYLLWARTGEDRFRAAAHAAARHWIDVDICRASENPDRLGGHVTHSAHHVTGNISPSHQWVEGLLDFYHHTGDEEALETAVGIGENILRALKKERYQKAGGFAVRELGWAVLACTALYNETHDERFLDQARDIVDRFVAWQKDFGSLKQSHTTHTLVQVPFMIALTLRNLMPYYETTGDARVPALIEQEVDGIIEHCLGPEGFPVYKGLPPLERRQANAQVLGVFALAHKVTGWRRYLEFAAMHLEWMLSPSDNPGGAARSVTGDAFIGSAGRAPREYAGPKEFSWAFLPLMEAYVQLAEADMLGGLEFRNTPSAP